MLFYPKKDNNIVKQAYNKTITGASSILSKDFHISQDTAQQFRKHRMRKIKSKWAACTKRKFFLTSTEMTDNNHE